MATNSETQEKHEVLVHLLKDLPSLAIAFSGGVDSSLLLAVAASVSSLRTVAVTGVSASLAKHQLEQAKQVAKNLDVRHILVETRELQDPRYSSNPEDRCFFCKEELFNRIRKDLGDDWPILADGSNFDDTADFRPGRQAAQDAQVLSPLVMANFTKADVRSLSKTLGLVTADFPASPCLASRLPTGVPVTWNALARIERAEEEIRKLGFADFRVRDLDGTARLEVASCESGLLESRITKEAAVGLMRYAGFSAAFVDDRPLRSGRLHQEHSVKKSSED